LLRRGAARRRFAIGLLMRFLKDNHVELLLQAGHGDRSNLEVHKAGGISGGVSIATLNLNVVPLNRGILFFCAGNGTAKVEQETFAGHFENAMAGSARSNLQIEANIPPAVQDIEIVVDKHSGGRVI